MIGAALPPFIRARNDRQGAQLIQVESSKLLPWLMLCCLLSGGAVIGSIWAVWLGSDNRALSRQTKTEIIDLVDHDRLSLLTQIDQSERRKEDSENRIRVEAKLLDNHITELKNKNSLNELKIDKLSRAMP